ncbi:hypothetical protein sscle_09g074750 [Sclerotinia sclerotiorum 1980 UF-70]|nr:hypothetical protein sscle_09g074750 [Sclerotinia sclerotiorum 1980 UF-70]
MSSQGPSTPTTALASMVTSAFASFSVKPAGLENTYPGSKKEGSYGKSLVSPLETSVVHEVSRRSDSAVVLCSTVFCDKFLKCKCLGDGAYGLVYLVEEITTGKKFALKLEKSNTGKLRQE